MSIDIREFRNTLGAFATGVTVVTTCDSEGGPVGMTANSFSSLSLDPPLVLFCIDRKVESFEAFQTFQYFAVNILAADQQDTSRRFARTGSEKWDGIGFHTWDSGCPILPDCIANLECKVESKLEGGDHFIMVGRVMRIANASKEGGPLTFFRGAYGRFVTA